MDKVVLFFVSFVVLVFVARSISGMFRPRIEVVDLGDRVRVILYYVSLDGKPGKKVIIY